MESRRRSAQRPSSLGLAAIQPSVAVGVVSIKELKSMLKSSVVGRAAGAILGVVALSAISSVAAQDYCIVCAEPDAVYRCQVAGAVAPGPGQAMSCITSLAAEGKHASCSFRPQPAGTPCNGALKTVTAAGGPVLVQPQTAQPEPGKPAAPETVEEAMKKMSSSAARQMEKTNDQIKRGTEATGTFVQRTFSCVTSLFTKCGGN